MKVYATSLASNGILLLSGFYNEDIPIIDVCCNENRLTLVKKLERNNWVSLKYIKSN